MTKRTKNPKVLLVPLKLPTVKPGASLTRTILDALHDENVRLKDGDVLTVASKVVSVCEGRIARLDQVRISDNAKRIGRKWRVNQLLAQLVIREADTILGGVRGFLLTIKNGFLTANAGVDLKNSPLGTATLWPRDPDVSARKLRKLLETRYGVRLGVEVVDSRVTPLRLGTTGLAIGVSGLQPVQDQRNKFDLYGRKVRVTQTNIADDLAASAHLLMGETDERIGTVLIRNAPVHLIGSAGPRQAKMGSRSCLITSNIIKVRQLTYS